MSMVELIGFFFVLFYSLYNTTIVCIIPMKIAKFNIFTLNLNSHIHGCIISSRLEVMHD